MRYDENRFQRQGFTRTPSPSGLEREERRGRSPTRWSYSQSVFTRDLQTRSGLEMEEGRGCSPMRQSMGDVYSPMVFTHDLQTCDQSLDYEGHFGRNPPAGENRVSGVPRARVADARRQRRWREHRPSCSRGGIHHSANGAAWEVSRRYGASNVDGMDNEAAEEDVLEEDFALGQFVGQDIDRMQPEPENPALPVLGSHFISTIAITARNISASPLDSNHVDNVQAVLDSLEEKTQINSTKALMVDNSLSSLAKKCADADQMSQAADLVYMLSCIELRAKVIWYVLFLFFQQRSKLFVPVFPLRLRPQKPSCSKGLNGKGNTGRPFRGMYRMAGNILF